MSYHSRGCSRLIPYNSHGLWSSVADECKSWFNSFRNNITSACDHETKIEVSDCKYEDEEEDPLKPCKRKLHKKSSPKLLLYPK